MILLGNDLQVRSEAEKASGKKLLKPFGATGLNRFSDNPEVKPLT